MSAAASQPRAGYTLPVFACAAAIAALRHLYHSDAGSSVEVDLLEPPEVVAIPVEQVARLNPHTALAITRSDPGDNLDLTRHTPVWAMVEQSELALTPSPTVSILLTGGEGIGKQIHANDQPSISAYARRLIETNLSRWLQPDEQIRVTIILPEGRALADRTSNAAFGVVEGLSLLGTAGISQPLSAPGQLEAYRQELQHHRDRYDALVFCIGENGLSLAQTLGIPVDRLIKTANWLGPLLVEAALQGVESILLFGYHGKLLKLAGGIFHTHHHVADGRQEILAAYSANAGLSTPDIQTILTSATAEAALAYLRVLDTTTGTPWVHRIYQGLAAQIDQRSEQYVYTHSERHVSIGSILFDRQRQIVIKSQTGQSILARIC